MSKKIFSFAILVAFIASANAQINLQGNTGNQAVDVQWTGTGTSDKIALNAYSNPSASYGYGIKTFGGSRGIYSESGDPSSNLRQVHAGEFKINTSSSISILRTAVYGTVNTAFGGTPATTYAGYFSGSTWCSSGSWSGSDSRIKTNIHNLDSSLALIMKLQPKKYEFNYSKYPKLGLSAGTKIGLLAQEVENVVPEVVRDVPLPEESQTDDLKSIKSIDYTAIIPVLVGAIQEQQKEINELKQKLNY